MLAGRTAGFQEGFVVPGPHQREAAILVAPSSELWDFGILSPNLVPMRLDQDTCPFCGEALPDWTNDLPWRADDGVSA
jgi:hypothetical protein